MSELIYHFCYILLVKTGHKASQNSKGGVFLGGRKGKNHRGLYREMGGVIMIIFANNLLHALFCIFHPFVSSCFGLNFLLSYLPVTNSLFNCI